VDTATLEATPETLPAPEPEEPAERRVRRPDEEDTVEEAPVPAEGEEPVSSQKAIHAEQVEDKAIRSPPTKRRMPSPAPPRRHPPQPKPKGRRSK
jgi:hypothetical protein